MAGRKIPTDEKLTKGVRVTVTPQFDANLQQMSSKYRIQLTRIGRELFESLWEAHQADNEDPRHIVGRMKLAAKNSFDQTITSPSSTEEVVIMKRENAHEIEELRAEIKRLTHELQILTRQNQHDRENERHEREKFMLQVENELLRRLPPKNDG